MAYVSRKKAPAKQPLEAGDIDRLACLIMRHHYGAREDLVESLSRHLGLKLSEKLKLRNRVREAEADKSVLVKLCKEEEA